MGKKLHWFKMWSDEFLSDRRVLRLSFPAKGVYAVMLCILRTQTDRPGYFIENGKIMDQDAIKNVVKAYQEMSKGCSRHVQKWTSEVLKSGLIKCSKDGLYYSSRIVEEYEESIVKQKAGRSRVEHPVEQAVEHPVEHGAQLEVEEKKKRSRREEEVLYTTAISPELLSGEQREDLSASKKEKKEAIDWNLVDTIGEVLGKLEGMHFKDHPEKGHHVNMVKQHPPEKIMQALASTQDAVIGGRNGERDKIKNPRIYFSKTLEGITKESDGLDEALEGRNE